MNRFPHDPRAVISGVAFLTLILTGCAAKEMSKASSASLHAHSPLVITTNSLPEASVGVLYTAAVSAQGGKSPYAWRVLSGQLPQGLTLAAATGAISGIPRQVGQSSFTIQVADSSRAKRRANRTFSISASGSIALDQYGGVVRQPCPSGAAAAFYVNKINNRWVFCTPAGHAMWMLGVQNVTPDKSTDDMGGNYYDRMLVKYGTVETWGRVQAVRLKSWGFNTLGEYSDYRLWFLLPNVSILNVTYYSYRNAYNYSTGPTKDLISGTDPTVYTGYRAHSAPDLYDPAYAQYADGYMAADSPGIKSLAAGPWLIALCPDDRDYLFGFGPGPDTSAGNSPHLAWIALVTAPTQASNGGWGVTYTDTAVHTKLALRDFLKTRYNNDINQLNAGWGSSYTSWDSAGGWGVGTGLLDEKGKHSWVCGDWLALSGCSNALKTDLDDFLYQYSTTYFQIATAKIKKYYPGHMVTAPAALNSDGVTRRQILKAAGENTDIIYAEIDSQQILDLTVKYAGDHPIIASQEFVANPDSAFFRYPQPTASWTATTQPARGVLYANKVNLYFNYATTASGTRQIAGFSFFQFLDKWAEKYNFGLVTLSDNAYDGRESVTGPGGIGVRSVPCSIPLGEYLCGGEERSYGDFIDPVRTANRNIIQALALQP
jgi:hypothetical protein